MIKALIFDIDGTLVGSNKRIPPLTRREIHRIHRDHGVEVIIATARGLDSAQLLAAQLGLPSSIIAFGGAVIASRPLTAQLFHQNSLDSDSVQVLVQAAQGLDVYVAVHSLTKCFINRFDYWARREIRNTWVWPELAPTVGGIPQFPNVGISKVMYRGERDDLDAISSRIEGLDTAFPHRTGRVLEVVPSQRLKLAALRELLLHLGVDPLEAMAFGDTSADVEMIEAVGVGVLMANSPPDLRVREDVVRTLSNDEDGIAVALRERFPCNEPFHLPYGDV